jgi:hypothetical protein
MLPVSTLFLCECMVSNDYGDVALGSCHYPALNAFLLFLHRELAEDLLLVRSLPLWCSSTSVDLSMATLERVDGNFVHGQLIFLWQITCWLLIVLRVCFRLWNIMRQYIYIFFVVWIQIFVIWKNHVDLKNHNILCLWFTCGLKKSCVISWAPSVQTTIKICTKL